MKTYQFRVPDDWDIKKCFKRFDGNYIELERPIDHGIFESLYIDIEVTDGEDEIIPGDEVTYDNKYGTKGIVYRIVNNVASLISINRHGHVRTEYAYLKDCVKTGRHYYQFEELMSNFDEIAMFLSKKED